MLPFLILVIWLMKTDWTDWTDRYTMWDGIKICHMMQIQLMSKEPRILKNLFQPCWLKPTVWRRRRLKVSNLRSNLFNPELLKHWLKPYQPSELEFHYSLLKGIEGSTKTLTRKLDNVTHVAQQLKAKFDPAVVMNAEEKSSKRRKKENTKKWKIEKRNH